MDITLNNNGLTGSLASLRQTANSRTYALKAAQEQQDAENLPAVVNRTPSAEAQQQGTRLVSETQDDLPGGGYRLTKTFEREDGRTFMKVEEMALTQRGTRKTVIQQSPSGSITRYEEVLDREGSGTFRRTQRFQDETGEVSTNITGDYKVSDPFVLSGGAMPSSLYATPFDSSRGTQLDLRA